MWEMAFAVGQSQIVSFSQENRTPLKAVRSGLIPNLMVSCPACRVIPVPASALMPRPPGRQPRQERKDNKRSRRGNQANRVMMTILRLRRSRPLMVGCERTISWSKGPPERGRNRAIHPRWGYRSRFLMVRIRYSGTPMESDKLKPSGSITIQSGRDATPRGAEWCLPGTGGYHLNPIFTPPLVSSTS